MQNTSMFDTLLELPLFRGVSREKMSETVGVSKFHFLKLASGKELVRCGIQSEHLLFVLSGSIGLTRTSSDGTVTVSQTITGPDVIGPEYLFGRVNYYPFTATAKTDASILEIEKRDFLNILGLDQIFLLNYLNYLSMCSHRTDMLLNISGEDGERRLAFFVLSLTQPGTQDIEIRWEGQRLADISGMCEEKLQEVLKSLKHKRLISYGEGFIKVANRRDLDI